MDINQKNKKLIVKSIKFITNTINIYKNSSFTKAYYILKLFEIQTNEEFKPVW